MGLETLHSNMRAEFRVRLLTLSDADFAANRIAYEGEKFTPSGGVPYFAESFRSVSAVLRSVANPDGGGIVEHILQGSVTAFFPDGEGTAAIERVAGKLMTLFRPTVRLSRGGDSAVIRNVERGQIYDDGPRIALAVTATFLAFTQS